MILLITKLARQLWTVLLKIVNPIKSLLLTMMESQLRTTPSAKIMHILIHCCLTGDLLNDGYDNELSIVMEECTKESVCLPPPDCFCGNQTIRLNSRLDSRMKGNPFYKCADNVCRFFRTAKRTEAEKLKTKQLDTRTVQKDKNDKSGTHVARPGALISDGKNDDQSKPKPVDMSSAQKGTNDKSGTQVVRPVLKKCIACADGNTPSGAHTCLKCGKAVHIFPECSQPAPGSDEGYGQKRLCMICFTQAAAVPDASISHCDNDDQSSMEVNGLSDIVSQGGDQLELRDKVNLMFGEFHIPPSVKHKGRPKGLTKTVHNWPNKGPLKSKSTKRPRGALLSLEDKEANALEGRLSRGEAIPDSDVSE